MVPIALATTIFLASQLLYFVADLREAMILGNPHNALARVMRTVRVTISSYAMDEISELQSPLCNSVRQPNTKTQLVQGATDQYVRSRVHAPPMPFELEMAHPLMITLLFEPSQRVLREFLGSENPGKFSEPRMFRCI